MPTRVTQENYEALKKENEELKILLRNKIQSFHVKLKDYEAVLDTDSILLGTDAKVNSLIERVSVLEMASTETLKDKLDRHSGESFYDVTNHWYAAALFEGLLSLHIGDVEKIAIDLLSTIDPSNMEKLANSPDFQELIKRTIEETKH